MSFHALQSILVAGMLLLPSALLDAAAIAIPNASFESPETAFVNLNIDSWQKAAKPPDYVEGGGFLWSQLTGIFKNTPLGNFDHIDNCDGNQAIWMFAVPEAGVFQDYQSVDWNDPAPTHGFDPTFEVGKSYTFTVGAIGGGGGMLDGVTAEISLYYRSGQGIPLTLAATTITNTSGVFGAYTHFVDFNVSVPTVEAEDSWAGKHVGIRLRSTVSADLQGGYWDFDNFRLTSHARPSVRMLFAKATEGLRVSWNSELDARYQIQVSGDLNAWLDFEGTIPGSGGPISKLIPQREGTVSFVRILTLPTP